MIHEAIDTRASTEYLDDLGEFFAPVSTDLIDGLVGERQARKAEIEGLANLVLGEGYSAAMGYFLEGNQHDLSRFGGHQVSRLFDVEGAVAALDADMWQRTLALTDVLDVMPADRRYEWNDEIRRHKAPAFEEATVRATLEQLLFQRAEFFAEKVDGVFRALSGQHVTNRPEGFSKKMIFGGLLDVLDFIDSRRCGYIHDLRTVLARFMGREEPLPGTTRKALDLVKRRLGVWHDLDGGAIRLKLYKKGTCHVEVHPELAYRLNAILASRYPAAIPAAFRKRPSAGASKKHFAALQMPLPSAVISQIADARLNGRKLSLSWYTLDQQSVRERQAIEAALAGIGGAKVDMATFEFDYDPEEALAHLVMTGCLPEQRSHQYYPTPASVAEEAVDLAEIRPHDKILEPSAGQGHLAEWLPQAQTTCVELADLHCKVLTAKGYICHHADFLAWAEDGRMAGAFSKVVMNPPFSQGRAALHLAAAAKCVAPGGRLVAVLPGSLRGKDVLPGWDVSWSAPRQGEFAGTGVTVVLLVADRPAV